jgi:hypothetical protein
MPLIIIPSAKIINRKIKTNETMCIVFALKCLDPNKKNKKIKMGNNRYNILIITVKYIEFFFTL